MKIVQSTDKSLSIVPETDFEMEHLAKFFLGNEQRKVIVKSGSGIGDIMSVDIIISNEKTYIKQQSKSVKMCGCNDSVEPKECSCSSEIFTADNSLINIVNSRA